MAPLQHVPMAIVESMMETHQRQRVKAKVSLFNLPAVRQGVLGKEPWEVPFSQAHPSPLPRNDMASLIWSYTCKVWYASSKGWSH